ncbi:Uncharacterised protein [Starkeya nomas]|uniref:Uncharacterized protein n=1 Tax=Starkeya nomas TaxID=2666134 RepID=A0A5S9NRT3_9HYPH|nr:Uncharacterised protein [Starkeya nomas]
MLLRDRVESGGRIGDDPRAILAGNAPVILGAVGLKPGGFHALRGCADLRLRLKVDALCLKAAVVDPRVYVEFRQPLVDVIGPAFAPTLDQIRAVPLPHLRAEAVRVHRPHGEHDMGMGLGQSVRPGVPMHIEIGDHALIDKLGLHEVAGQFDALRLCHLARNGELHLAAKLCVLSFLEGFNIIPEPFAVVPLLWGVFRQHHLGMDDARLVGEVVVTAQPVIAQPGGRARHSATWRRSSSQ